MELGRPVRPTVWSLVRACMCAMFVLLGILTLPGAALAAPPANDPFSGAEVLVGQFPSTTGTNIEATKQAGEPNHNGNAGGASVWYEWKAPANATVTLDTFGSSFDTLLSVYTGTAVNGLSFVAGNDDSGGTPQSRVEFTAVQDTIYKVAVDGYNGVSGTVRVTVNRRPTNDAFASAQAMIGTSASLTGSTLNGSRELGEPLHATQSGGASVWYAWTAPSAGLVTVSTAGSAIDTLLGIYTGAAVSGLVEVASSDDVDATPQSRASFIATAGTTYAFAIDGKGGVSGNVSIDLNMRPSNDDLATSIVVPAAGGTLTGSNVRGTKESGEPNHGGNAGGASLWYDWTPTTSAWAVVETPGSAIDTVLGVYTGSDVTSLSLVGQNDDANAGLQSKVKFNAVAGTRYRIAVDGKGGATGNTSLTIRFAPPNDDLEDAILISGMSGTSWGTTTSGTSEAGEPSGCSTNSVWHRWVAPTSGLATLELYNDTSYWHKALYVYQGATMGTLAQVATTDAGNYNGATSGTASWTATAGATYLFRTTCETGSFRLRVNVGNEFLNPLSISGIAPTTTGRNSFGDAELGEPVHGGVPGGPSFWYTWTAPQNGTVYVNTYDSTFDTVLAVYTGSTVNALTPIASNDDAGGTLQSSMSFGVVAGTTYRIAIDGKSGATGNYTLRLRYPPVNDAFTAASPVGAWGTGATPLTGSNIGATKEAGEANHGGNAGGGSVWWEITPAIDGKLTLDTNGSAIDTLLAIYGPVTGATTAASATLVAQADDQGAVLRAALTTPVTGGTTYRIAIDGKNGISGDVQLSATLRPLNDNFADAILVAGHSPVTSGYTDYATSEANEPSGCANSTWHKWVATATGPARVELYNPGSYWHKSLYVYQGTTINSLVQVGLTDAGNYNGGTTGTAGWNATAGTTYMFRTTCESGYHRLRFNVGNDFANPNSISGASATTSGSNIFTDKELLEPDHAGDAGGKSTWYTWVAPTSGTVYVNTYDSTFDTLLGVYTGASVDALTPVASNDDAGGTLQSSASFNVVAGTTYRIAIDGKAGATGNYTLRLRYPPVNDAFASANPIGGWGTGATPATGSNIGATKQSGEPDHGGNSGGGSVWWEYTPAIDGKLTLDTNGSAIDTLLAIYGPVTGATTPATAPLVAQADDQGAVLRAALTTQVTGGVTYRIAIDGKNGISGDVQLSAVLRPLNDSFVDAILLTGHSPVSGWSYTDNATSEANEPSGCANSTWHKWVATATGPARVELYNPGSYWHKSLYVYQGTTINSLVQVAVTDAGNYNGVTTNTAGWNATAGTTYMFRTTCESGNHRLRLNVGNDFANPNSFSGTSGTTSGSNIFTDLEAGEPQHAGDPGGHSTWVTWTAPSNGTVSVNTYDSAFDTLLGVYTGSSVGALTPVASNDDAGGTLQSSVSFGVVAGTTYRIAVDGKGGATGNYTLRLRYPPTNDSFASPTAIGAWGTGGTPSTSSTIGATKQAGEANHGGNAGGASVWWEITPAITGNLTLDPDASALPDTMLAVYGPIVVPTSTVSNAQLVAQVDDVGADRQGWLTVAVTAGVTYRIAVDGKNGLMGDVQLAAVLRPSNDAFSSFQTLPLGTSTGWDTNATSEAFEPSSCGNTVWYRYTSPWTDPLTFDLYNVWSYWHKNLDVYTGNTIASLTRLGGTDAGNYNGQTTGSFTVASPTVGQTYILRVNCETDAFQITVRQPPPNDAFASPQVLSGMRATATGRTVGASRQASEPTHAGNAGGASTWYSWVAPAGGTVTVDTFGSDFDTLLGAYTGSAIGSLTQVASNDDAPGSTQSRLTFTAVAGQTYRFAVDGKGGATGTTALYLNRGPSNDAWVDARVVNGWGAVVSANSEGAISETGEPSHAGQAAGASIWYTWTPQSSGTATIDTSGSAIDTTLGVYTGSNVGSLTTVGSNDDNGGGGTWSSVSFPATAGTTYMIAVSGKAGAAGNTRVNVSAPLGVQGVTPNTVSQGATGAAVTINGGGFDLGPTVSFSGGGITVQSATWISATQINAVVDIAPGATLGLRAVTVTNADLDTATRADVLTVVAPDTTAPETTITSGPTGRTAGQTPAWGFTADESSTFQCRLDAGAWTTCASPWGTMPLADGNHTFEVRATDASSNVDATPASATVDIDTMAPDTTIDSGPSGATNDNTPTWAFSSNEGANATFECRLDGAAWGSCPSPYTSPALAAGGHTFDVRATDDVGNVEPIPATRSITIDLVAPDTTITAGPSGTTLDSTPTWDFTSTEPGTFDCRIDAGVWTSCSSPWTAPLQADGMHQFDVRAVDAAGNVDATPDTRSVFVDAASPDTTITSGPSGPTGDATPTWVFTTSEPATTECSLDGSPWSSCGPDFTAAALADGAHDFAVRSTDGSGNVDPTPATRSILVDTIAPDTTITSGPSGVTVTNTPTWTFSSNEPGGFECSVDSGAWTSCATPFTPTMADGAHDLAVRAVDAAGNVDAAPATRSVVIDATTPQTTIDGGPTGPTNDATPTWSFSASEAATFECRLDAAAWATCTSPFTTATLADGPHVFDVRATDGSGNVDASPATASISLDGTAPQTTITGGPTGRVALASPTFDFTSTEVGTYECRIDAGTWDPCDTPFTTGILVDGAHDLRVRAIDAAGNVDATPALRSFIVDTTSPDTTIDTGPSGPLGLTSATWTFSATESTSRFDCRVDGAAWTACASGTFSTTGLADGPHSFQVIAIDLAGSVDPTPATRTVIVDTVAPQTSIDSGPLGATNNARPAWTFSASEAGTYQCRMDGGSWAGCISPYTSPLLNDGPHTVEVRAIDAAGNVDASPATQSVTVDAAAPETEIGSGPSGNINDPSPTWTLTATESATFECRVDAATWVPCSTPFTTASLADGRHDFAVRAVDDAGNVDPTPAERAFVVDTIDPDTTIDAGPGAETSVPTVDLSFSSNERGTFQCRLNEGTWTACESPMHVINLPIGHHSFATRSIDIAGNIDASPALRSFDVTAKRVDNGGTDGSGGGGNNGGGGGSTGGGGNTGGGGGNGGGGNNGGGGGSTGGGGGSGGGGNNSGGGSGGGGGTTTIVRTVESGDEQIIRQLQLRTERLERLLRQRQASATNTSSNTNTGQLVSFDAADAGADALVATPTLGSHEAASSRGLVDRALFAKVPGTPIPVWWLGLLGLAAPFTWVWLQWSSTMFVNNGAEDWHWDDHDGHEGES